MGIPILGANTASTGDLITNSLRFNDDDSAYLSRQNSSGGSRQIFTTSFWIKRANLTGNGMKIFDVGTSTSTDTGRFYIGTFGSDKLAVVGGATTFRVTNAVLRDLSAWYHIVVAVDSTQGTADNRVKVYLNGNQVTSFDTNNAMTQNQNTPVNENAKYHQIGRNQPNTSEYYDGYIAEFHHVDGTQYAASNFGEFNDNGVWIPKEVDVTYGTNGAHLQFKQTGTSANASGIGADTSGNGNHFTPTNLAAIDITTDTCQNNFATLNPLTNSEVGNAPTFAEGNLKITMTNFDTESIMATTGVTQGKWYWEVKGGWKTSNWGFGIEKASSSNVGFNVGYTATSYSFSQNGYKQNNSSASQIDSGLSDGDIIGYALDLDNGYFNFSQNGTWYNGSASESTTFDTGNHDFSSLDFGSEFVMPTISAFGDGAITTEINFGQPTFSISSGNSDANGYGNFEYAPPSGYYSLCSKNIAEFG